MGCAFVVTIKSPEESTSFPTVLPKQVVDELGNKDEIAEFLDNIEGFLIKGFQGNSPDLEFFSHSSIDRDKYSTQ